jgi:glycosyltransferase involved in cell wall biosynthesis
MNLKQKPTCVFYGAVDTFSGYGARARGIAKALIELKGEEWDIKILSCRWGSTPSGFIDEHPEWEFLKKYIQPNLQLSSQPDYMFWNTIPSEGQIVGKWNCLITAGIESTIAPADWIEGCQRMDLVLGSSKHTIDVLRNSKFEKRDQNTNQVAGIIEWNKPGDVLFEGIEEDIYKPQPSSTFDLSSIPEDFCYLFNSMWTDGDFGEDRKNVGLLIKAFFETFKNKSKKPALILKTTTVGASYMDRDKILKRIKAIQDTVKSTNLPNIYLLHGEVSDKDINELNNHPKVKAMISLTKGEGWGRCLAEFSVVNKPIITTNFSGHKDYLNPEFTTLLNGNLTQIHPSAANNMLLREASWFSVDYGQVGYYLNDVFENYKKYNELAKRQGYHSRTNFSFNKMKEKFEGILSSVPSFAQPVNLVLPTMNKSISLPKLKKL